MFLDDNEKMKFGLIEATALTADEWAQGDLFVTDFARNGEILFAA